MIAGVSGWTNIGGAGGAFGLIHMAGMPVPVS